jgi:hypothetical protein
MRFGSVVPSVLLAGCFAPEPPAGVPCASASSSERCPTGQVCVISGGAEVCMTGPGDAPPDAPGFDIDGDGDGIPDVFDNCPLVPNLDQSDEDRDGLGDVCDPCPPFDANGDEDNDGVGDGCDPHPLVAGDRIVAFEGFARPLPASWTTSGMVVVAGGRALAMASEATSAVISLDSPAAARVEIRASMTLLQITATADTLGGIGVMDRLEPGTDKAIVCQLVGLSNGTQEELRIFNTATAATVNNAPHAFDPGLPTELRMRRDGTNYLCRATGPSLELAGAATFSPAAPRIGLRARSAAAFYDWVMVVTSP